MRIIKRLQTLLMLVAAMLAVFIVEAIFPGDLTWLGIRPRSVFGLIGIPLSPFLHSDLAHLCANAVPILIMGGMLSALNPDRFLYRTVVLIVGSGALTWCISSAGIVIGASGLVFAYWAFLIVNGIKSRDLTSIVAAAFTILVYGSLLLGLFQNTPGISWAGHFSGALFGGFFAWKGARRS